MDLDPIGKHCALQSCKLLDFLPIRCSCLQWFCKLHISANLHDCPSVQQRPIDPEPGPPSLSTSARPKCAFLACNKLSLSGVTAVEPPHQGEPSREVSSGRCARCQLSFCVDHRHLQSHSCAGLGVNNVVKKHEAARVLLAEKFLVPGTQPSHTPVVARQRINRNLPTDPQKLAQLQKVDLMKLRHRAVPGDPKDRNSAVPVDQRFHVIVRVEIVGQSAKEVVMWFRKTMITGKALDLVARHFDVSHTASTLCLKRSSAENESRVLHNHLELSGQIGDGSTIVLTDSL